MTEQNRALSSQRSLFPRPTRALLMASIMLLLAVSAFNTAALHAFATPPYAALPGSVPAPVATATLIGHHNSTATLTVGVMLYPDNQAGIDRLLSDLYDPHNSLYHHWLNKGQFTTQFGPTSMQSNAVKSFLTGAGLQLIASPGPLLIAAAGQSSQMEAAFHTTINDYRQPDGTVSYANSTLIQVPATLQNIVEGVFGLDNFPAVQSMLSTHRTNQTSKSSYGGGPNGTGLTPSQIAGIYDAGPVYTNLNTKGQGVTLGLMEFSNYTSGDIGTYESQFGLSSVTQNVVSVQGGTSDHSGAGEVELDIEMMIALAPSANSIQVYEAPNTTLGDEWGYYQIASDDQTNAISTSWGNCEATTQSSEVVSEAQSFKIMALQGQSMFAATGDNGAYACLPFNKQSTLAVQDPGSQPYVTGIGGTSFAGTFDPGTNPNPTYPTGKEQAWNNNCTPTTCTAPNGGGGGGVSRLWAQSSYQTGPGVIESKYSKTGSWCKQATGVYCREVPDVSLDADWNSGYSAYCTDPGDTKHCSGWAQFGGTSAAAPLWAAIAGLIDSYHFAHSDTSFGFANSFLYQLNVAAGYSNVFHDIAKGKGTNGNYPTGTAYDMATGIGSIDIYQLVLHSLYPPYQQTVYVGSSDHFMYALNASTGALIWRYATGNTPSTPVAVNGILYFSSDEIYALNATNGSVVWRYPTGSINNSTPIVVNGVVYVGSDDDYLYALNASTGSLLWRYQTSDYVSSPNVVNGVVYFTSDSTYALNASNGSLIWNQAQYGDHSFTPIPVYNGKVYITANYNVYAINTSDGSIVWETGQLGSEYTPYAPIVANGTVYVSSSGGTLFALNTDTGATLWSYNSNQYGYSIPSVVNGTIYIGFGYNVDALKASDGTFIWSYSTGNYVGSTPAESGGVVYAGSNDSYVYSLNAGNGSLIWRYQTGSGQYGTVASPLLAP